MAAHQLQVRARSYASLTTMRRMRYVWSGLSAGALFVLCGCSPASVEHSGYHVASPHTGNYCIIKASKEVVIKPNLRKIGTCNLLLYGYCIPYEYPDGLKTSGGYFILDTSTGSKIEGLSKQDFDRSLEKACDQKPPPPLKTVYFDF